MNDLPALLRRRQPLGEIEIEVEQAHEIEPVEGLVEPAGERPILGAGEILVFPGPEVGDAAKGPVR